MNHEKRIINQLQVSITIVSHLKRILQTHQKKACAKKYPTIKLFTFTRFFVQINSSRKRKKNQNSRNRNLLLPLI